MLSSMGIKIKLPIIVRVDNIGAMFMSNNTSISERTKHVDVRYHFIREFVEDGFIKIMFVKTKQNTADVFTKNLPKELFDQHVSELLSEKELKKI